MITPLYQSLTPLGRGAGVAPFDPASVAGLILCTRARNLVLSDGDLISTWADTSASSNNATAFGTNRPTFKTNILNGRPVVRFAGGQQLDLTHISQLTNTVFVVIRKSVVDSGYRTFFSIKSALYIARSSGSDAWELYTDNDRTSGQNINSWSILTSQQNNTSSLTLFTNGTQNFTGTSTGIVNVASSTIGSNSTTRTQDFTGDIADILVYDSILSTANRQYVERGLGSEYGITVA